MLAKKILDFEQKFHSTGSAQGKKYSLAAKSIAISGQDKEMPYTRCKPINDDNSYFYRNKFNKKKVVLHFTVGYLQGDIRSLSKTDYHVSVAFVIGRNGHIYNLFPSAYWSYHLGSGAIGGNTNNSKHSIGIELSNIGPLKQRGDELFTVYDKPSRIDKYCDLWQTQYYNFIDEPYRKYQYFASFTDKQYSSLSLLLDYLTTRYKIPREFLPPEKRYSATTETANFNGIVSHVNFRKSGKWDIGPTFEWDRII